MSVLEAAKALAGEIADSAELKEMREAELAMNNDPEAVKLIQEFQVKQQELQAVYAQGQELTDEQKAAISEVEAKMTANESVSNYINAQHKLEHMLQSVSMMIQQAISGEEPSGCSESSCGSCCGSCG